MRASAIAAVAALLAPMVTGQWHENRARVADESWRKTSGEFGAMVVLTDDFEAFKAEWAKPGIPTIHSQDKVARGQLLVAVVVFSGCSTRDGKCDVRVDYEVVRPDGSEYAAHSDLPAWPGKPAPPKGVVVLSEALLGIRIEPEDPGGTYRVKARVRDRFGVAVDLERSFSVRD